MKLTIIVISAFIIWFFAVWTSVVALISIIGGWKTLSVLYPADRELKNDSEKKFSFCSIRLGMVGYRSCINIYFFNDGIMFEVMKIFRVMHKPVFIPYNRITGIKKGKFITSYIEFSVDQKKVIIYGKAGAELFSRLDSAEK